VVLFFTSTDNAGVTARRLAAAIFCMLAFCVGPAGAHSIPQTWWLDERTALAKLKVVEKSRWKPSAYEGLTGVCRGVAPRATRDGRSVYKHFTCSARVRVNHVNFSFSTACTSSGHAAE